MRVGSLSQIGCKAEKQGTKIEKSSNLHPYILTITRLQSNIINEGKPFEKHTHSNAFITYEAESVMEGGDCGGSRKVATHHNPSQLR